MNTIIAVVDKKGRNVVETAFTMLKALKPQKPDAYGLASPSTTTIGKSLEALKAQKIESPIVIGCAFARILEQDAPQPLKLKHATLVFNGRIYPHRSKDSDAQAAVRKLQSNFEQNARDLVAGTEGDFAFVIAETQKLVAGRDTMGACPLYYSENTDAAALASERQALWRIDMQETESFPPGDVATVDENGFRFTSVRRLNQPKLRKITMQAAAERLQVFLQQAVAEKVSGLKDVAVAFSGGLDSSIVAFLAKKSGVNVHLIHVSLENKTETEFAEKMAAELGIPLHSYVYAERSVEEALQRVLWLIEEPDPVKISIGIPVHWAAEKAAKMNLKVMLAGQGADELFGGYKRYVDEYQLNGVRKAEETILKDITEMHAANLERDFKICNFHNVELRLPFIALRVVRFAMELPLELKIEPSSDSLRKLVLRKTAEKLGLPQAIVNRPKRAIQYATGVNEALRKIAKQNRLSINEYLQKTFLTVQQKMTQHD